MTAATGWDRTLLHPARAEASRAAASPGLRVLLGCAVAVTVLLGYVAVRAVIGLVDGAEADPELAGRLADLSPARVRQGMASVVSTTLPVLALVSGGLLVRADFGGHLFRLLLGRGVSRAAYALGKLAVSALVAVVASITTLAAALVAASVVGGSSGWTGLRPADLLVLLATGAVSWWLWSLVGLLVSVLFRSATAAMVLAVGWLVAAAPLAGLAQQPGASAWLARSNPSVNVTAVLAGGGDAGAAVAALAVTTVAVVGLTVLAVRRCRPS